MAGTSGSKLASELKKLKKISKVRDGGNVVSTESGSLRNKPKTKSRYFATPANKVERVLEKGSADMSACGQKGLDAAVSEVDEGVRITRSRRKRNIEGKTAGKLNANEVTTDLQPDSDASSSDFLARDKNKRKDGKRKLVEESNSGRGNKRQKVSRNSKKDKTGDRKATKPQEKIEIRNFSRVDKAKYSPPKSAPHTRTRKRKTETVDPEEADNDDEDEDDEDDDDDWEEVTEGMDAHFPKPKRPIEPVEIVVQKRGTKSAKDQMLQEIRCAVNRMKMMTQKYCHQVHLLCFLASGLRYSDVCNEPELRAIALSQVPSKFLAPDAATWKVETLIRVMTWFHKDFPCASSQDDESCLHGNILDLINTLKTQLVVKKARSRFEHCMMIIITLRSLGLRVRLIHSFQPMTSKPSDLLKKPPSAPSNVIDPSKKLKISSKKISAGALKKQMSEIPRKNKNVKIARSTDSKNSQREVDEPVKRSLRKSRTAKAISYDDDDDDDDDEEEEDEDGVYVGDDADDGKKSSRCDGKKFDWWSEVYLSNEKRWIYVNGQRCIADDFDDAKKNIKRPFSYVLAYDNEAHVKDLTSKYDPDWLTQSCKKRVDPDWWESTLDFYKDQSEEDICESLKIEADLFQQPLPNNVSAYKNHPLYVLRRHLLRFECIHPPDSLVLGHVRGEPVYSRDSVRQLHSREKWNVEGRVVRAGEEPCKVVKKRPKSLKNKQNKIPEGVFEDLMLFGEWQTSLFVPEPAVNGIVPKNGFGNVEVFKPWMLPPGTVLIEDPMLGLHKVAKKLNLDIAPAMRGWEFHRNTSAPIIRGWVVCTEHQEILEAAWQEEQVYLREKARKKKEERAMKNWRKLMKAFLIRQRIKDQFEEKVSVNSEVEQHQTTKSIIDEEQKVTAMM